MSTFIINSFSFIPVGLSFNTSPTTANVYSVGFDVMSSINQNGTIYLATFPGGSIAPNANSIINQTAPNAIAFYSEPAEKDFVVSFPIRNLAPSTTYDFYAVGRNSSLETTSVSKITANTPVTPTIYETKNSGYILGNQNTVWVGNVAPPIGAIANISHVVSADYGFAGSLIQQSRISESGVATDRTFNVKEFGNFELGDVSKNAGSGGYYSFWDVLRNSVVNLESNSCFSIQYLGDQNGVESKGKINVVGDDVTICSLNDFQLQGFGSLNVLVPTKIYIEAFYTNASTKTCTLFFNKMNVNENTRIIARPGMNRSAFLGNYHGLQVWNNVVYTSYTASNTSSNISPIASISSTNNTVVFANNFVIGPTGQLVEGRYVNITGSSTSNNNVLRCIRKVVNENTVELFGNPLVNQGASGIGQICPVGNPNSTNAFLVGDLFVANNKTLSFENYPTFNNTFFSTLTVVLFGKMRNYGTIEVDLKNKSFNLSGDNNVPDANSYIGNLVVKGTTTFNYLATMQRTLSNTKILSYSIDSKTRDLILSCNNVTSSISIIPSSFSVDGTAITSNAATITNDTITLNSALSPDVPLLNGILVDINSGSGPVYLIKNVNNQRNQITLQGNTGLTNAIRTIKLKYLEIPYLIQNMTEEPLLERATGYVKRIIPDENKLVVTFEKDIENLPPSKTFTTPQGDFYISNGYNSFSFFGVPFTGAIKTNLLQTANITMQNTSSLIGGYFGFGITQNIGGNFIFEGTSHNVWFGGYQSVVEIDTLELRNNTAVVFVGSLTGQSCGLRTRNLKLTGNATIRSTTSNQNAQNIYLNNVSGNGTLTFTPRNDSATSVTLNRLAIQTSSTSNVITFGGGLIINRNASNNQICFDIASGKTVQFKTLQIEANVIPPGTYTTSNTVLLSAFTGSGQVVVLE